jgi:hypothetical protein
MSSSVLQPNMILPGLDAPVPPPEVVAKYTVQVSKITLYSYNAKQL